MAPQQAIFNPLPPDLDLHTLVGNHANLHWVERISIAKVKEMGPVGFQNLVTKRVVIGGKPLIVEGWERDLSPWLFSSIWLVDNMGQKHESVRDISRKENMQMTIGHYLENMGKLTNFMTPEEYNHPKRQRLYLKDIDCPQQWSEHLKNLLPKFIYYMNENEGDKDGPGASTYKDKYGRTIHSQGIAPAGDMMANLPSEMRAENLMCYIGHEGTYTPAHKEMCATAGQNIMVETSSPLNGEKEGSSIWFMTEAQDRQVVSEYFLSVLGHSIDVENHFAQLAAWKKAPFPVFIAEQKVGDMVLVPPLAPHQVWNRGQRTMKVAWNRTTIETLEMAINEALPRARMVCRDEQYKVKATIYHSLLKYYSRLRDADKAEDAAMATNKPSVWHSEKVIKLQSDFLRLFMLFEDFLVEEMFDPNILQPKKIDEEKFDGNITCSYCRCNIFNRFLTCKHCVEELANGEQDTYDICMDCYLMGRSCACISKLTWVEQWKWSELEKRYKLWSELCGFISNTIPLPQSVAQSCEDASEIRLENVRKRKGRKTTAHACQDQLARRPFRDITKPPPKEPTPPPTMGDSDIEPGENDADGYKKVTKKKGGRRKSRGGEMLSEKPCHTCKKPEKPWKLAECTQCDKVYCYGVLWRAFEIHPDTVMKDLHWVCPDCRDICNCGECRKKYPNRNFYEPKGTILGHDTKKVADYRSVESLVDFSTNNLQWVAQFEGDQQSAPSATKRIRNLIEQAKAEKAKNKDAELELQYRYGLEAQPEPVYAVDRMRAPEHIRPPTAPVQPDFSNAGYPVEIAPGGFGGPPLPEVGYQPAQGNGFVSPADLLNRPESVYPEDRFVGMREEDDNIVFDDPEAESAIGNRMRPGNYPKMREQNDDGLPKRYKKNKRQQMIAEKELDPSHKDYLKQQRKIALDKAKLNNNKYMTMARLDGLGPLRIVLKVPNKIAELRALEERERVRHNPREKRASAAHLNFGGADHFDEDEVMDDDIDASLVMPDLKQPPKPKARRASKASSTDDGLMDIDYMDLSASARPKKKVGRPRKSDAGYTPQQMSGQRRVSVRTIYGNELDSDPFEDRVDKPKRSRTKSAAKMVLESPAGARSRPRGCRDTNDSLASRVTISPEANAREGRRARQSMQMMAAEDEGTIHTPRVVDSRKRTRQSGTPLFDENALRTVENKRRKTSQSVRSASYAGSDTRMMGMDGAQDYSDLDILLAPSKVVQKKRNGKAWDNVPAPSSDNEGRHLSSASPAPQQEEEPRSERNEEEAWKNKDKVSDDEAEAAVSSPQKSTEAAVSSPQKSTEKSRPAINRQASSPGYRLGDVLSSPEVQRLSVPAPKENAYRLTSASASPSPDSASEVSAADHHAMDADAAEDDEEEDENLKFKQIAMQELEDERKADEAKKAQVLAAQKAKTDAEAKRRERLANIARARAEAEAEERSLSTSATDAEKLKAASGTSSDVATPVTPMAPVSGASSVVGVSVTKSVNMQRQSVGTKTLGKQTASLSVRSTKSAADAAAVSDSESGSEDEIPANASTAGGNGGEKKSVVEVRLGWNRS